MGVPKVLKITLGSAIWLQISKYCPKISYEKNTLILDEPIMEEGLMKFLSVSVNVIILTFQATSYSENWLKPILQIISAQEAWNLEIGEVKMNFDLVVSVECQRLQIQQWAFFAGGQTDVKSIIVACAADRCRET